MRRSPVHKKRHRNISAAMPLRYYVISGSVMSSILIIASAANRISGLKPSTNEVISFLSPLSDAQSLAFQRSPAAPASVSVPAHPHCGSQVQYVRIRTASDDVPIRRADVSVIPFFYDTSHAVTSFGRDTQCRNKLKTSMQKAVC